MVNGAAPWGSRRFAFGVGGRGLKPSNVAYLASTSVGSRGPATRTLAPPGEPMGPLALIVSHFEPLAPTSVVSRRLKAPAVRKTAARHPTPSTSRAQNGCSTPHTRHRPRPKRLLDTPHRAPAALEVPPEEPRGARAALETGATPRNVTCRRAGNDRHKRKRGTRGRMPRYEEDGLAGSARLTRPGRCGRGDRGPWP